MLNIQTIIVHSEHWYFPLTSTKKNVQAFNYLTRRVHSKRDLSSDRVEAETEMYAQMSRLSGQPRRGAAKGQHNPVATLYTIKKTDRLNYHTKYVTCNSITILC